VLKRYASIALLSVSITACTPLWQTKPSQQSPESLWDLRYKKLTELHSWKFDGRTVITQDKEGWNAGLRWQEMNGDYLIKLEGPFSQGGVTLEGLKDGVVLTMSDGQQYVASSPEALVSEVLKADLPVSALRYWVKGMPYPSETTDMMQHDEEGRLTELQQGQWQVKFKRYIPFENDSMPSKIFIEHKKLSVRMIIRDWDRL